MGLADSTPEKENRGADMHEEASTPDEMALRDTYVIAVGVCGTIFQQKRKPKATQNGSTQLSHAKPPSPFPNLSAKPPRKSKKKQSTFDSTSGSTAQQG